VVVVVGVLAHARFLMVHLAILELFVPLVLVVVHIVLQVVQAELGALLAIQVAMVVDLGDQAVRVEKLLVEFLLLLGLQRGQDMEVLANVDI
jgi:hypothetical protein